MIDQFGHAPQNDQERPVNSNQMTKSECWVESVEQENDTDHDKEQAG